MRAAATAALFVALVSPAQEPSFRAETRLVVVHAIVKNSRGQPVIDLDRAAFTVYENGRPQPITLFRRDDVPVSLGLLIDNSGSMRTLRSRVESAALSLARASNPDDEIFVVNFNDTVRVDVPFTNDAAVLQRGIARVDSIGGTAMRDALEAAQNYLSDHATRDRKVLVVITDGVDNASATTAERIEQAAELHDTVVFAIGLFGNSEHAGEGRHQLDRLTEKTGGLAYYPESVDDVQTTALAIAHQIRNQYTIGYTPLNQALDGSYRSIRVAAAGRERLTVRARAGYRAVRY